LNILKMEEVLVNVGDISGVEAFLKMYVASL
jgi:hypothetical protein